jgi:hypothetical protein
MGYLERIALVNFAVALCILFSVLAGFWHIYLLLGENHGCKELACYVGLNIAPAASARVLAVNTTHLGTYPTAEDCESACIAFKVPIFEIDTSKGNKCD